jgi:hypothetical protein
MPEGAVNIQDLLKQNTSTPEGGRGTETIAESLGDIVSQIRENIVIRRALNIRVRFRIKVRVRLRVRVRVRINIIPFEPNPNPNANANLNPNPINVKVDPADPTQSVIAG